MRKRIVVEPDLDIYESADDACKNRLLLDWLSDDQHRTKLYDLINQRRDGALEFPSRDASPRECDCEGLKQPRTPAVSGHRKVRLVTARQTIEQVLVNSDRSYSNRVYAELGGGSFMLALDPHITAAHGEQRNAFLDCFPHTRQMLFELSHKACQAATTTSLRAPEFDMATFAEQAALRYCQKLLGYALADYLLLEASLRDAYAGLVYQVFGRHFASDPTAIPKAKQAMAVLLKRTAELIDAYANHDLDALKGCKDRAVPAGFEPVLKKLGERPGAMNGEQRAIVALGAAVGTVGNVQAAACIAMKALFASKEQAPATGNRLRDDSSAWGRARRLARSEYIAGPTENLNDWMEILAPFLRDNPPIPFLPRLLVDQNGVALQEEPNELVLALGGATANQAPYDPLVWGLPPGDKLWPAPVCPVGATDRRSPHWCAGMSLAWPLLVEIVRHAMALPGLAERLDPEDASVIGLKKRWGFACESYPLVHRRDENVAQSSLNVAMRLKAPVRDNADRVRGIIRAGAPRIEEALRESHHVHFAWFELTESDSVLVLHTVYDGPFDAYIQHFALKVGDMFDKLFECIEDPPPMPVDKFPSDFVAHIQRYNRQPAMGYFFSAYPRSDVARIMRDELARP